MTQKKAQIQCKTEESNPLEHDFLTSLNIIFLCTEILENYDHLCTENKKQEYLCLIREAAQQMNQVFHQVLKHPDVSENVKLDNRALERSLLQR